jgi:hypothetical protein
MKDTVGAAMHWRETESRHARDWKTKKSFWLIKRIDIFKKKNGRAINNDFINICFFRFCTFSFAQKSSRNTEPSLVLVAHVPEHHFCSSEYFLRAI